MFFRAFTLFVWMAVAAQVVVASSPSACVKAAVDQQPDPTNLQAVCNGNSANEVKQYIKAHCDPNVEAALNAFNNVCLAYASSSNSTTPSTSPTSASAAASSSTAASATSASPTSTGNSVASRVGMDILGMAAIGMFGAMLAL